MESTILVPFMIIALIAFVVFIMCVTLMIDIKLKAIAKNVADMRQCIEEYVKKEMKQ